LAGAFLFATGVAQQITRECEKICQPGEGIAATSPHGECQIQTALESDIRKSPFGSDIRKRNPSDVVQTSERGYQLRVTCLVMEDTMNNLLTDVAGVRVGHADDARLGSGVTAVIFDRPAVAAMDVRGGGPGTREGALLDVANTVEKIDAIALAGGSAFGLEAGAGVQAWLAEHGRGFELRGAIIPIVPGAIFFDLLNGGSKDWGRFAPYRDLGYVAAAAASTSFALGSVGAGLGANTANLKGGLGSASARTSNGVSVAALAVVNPVGTVTIGDGPWFWAAPFELNGEYGGRGMPAAFTPDMLRMRIKGGPLASPLENTTLAVVVTDAFLTKPQVKRLAVIAQTGFARAINPVHAPLDGDVVFAAATGERQIDPLVGLTELGMVAAHVTARAIARGVYAATALPFAGALPAWRDRFA
jgi:L-aminopeptidase/D-esterase-like protein